MSIHRRDFMKLLGMSLASLYLTRCNPPFQTTCYAPIPVTPTALPLTGGSARNRLRLCWLGFGELAVRSQEDTETDLKNKLVSVHRLALDELVAGGEISAPVADLVQEAYGAAVYHVWRSNVPMTCYEPLMVDFAPTGANVLVQQSHILYQLSFTGTVDPATLAKAQAALEHDLSYYALSEQDVQELYDRLLAESRETGQPLPPFEAVSLELTPEAQEATRFIIDLLTGQ